MTKITESAIETFAIELFEKLGYQYIYASDIAPDKVNGIARECALGYKVNGKAREGALGYSATPRPKLISGEVRVVA